MNKVTLRAKLITCVTAGLVLFGLAVGIYISLSVSPRLMQELRKRGIYMCESVARRSVDPLLLGEIITLKMLYNQIVSSSDDVKYVFLIGKNGEITAHTFGGSFPVALRTANEILPGEEYSVQKLGTSDGDILDIAVPVLKGDLGVVHIGVSEEFIKRDVRGIEQKLVAIIVLFLVVSVAGTVVFTVALIKPIEELTKTAELISKGDLDRKVKVTTNDEIGYLGSVFNEMMSGLKKSRDEILSARDYVDSIIMNMADTLVVITPEAKIKTVNVEISELLGYEENELIGRSMRMILDAPDSAVEDLLDKLMRRQTVKGQRFFYKANTGERIPMDLSGAAMYDPKRDLSGMIIVARDMREKDRLIQKEKEASVATAAAKAEYLKAEELKRAYKRLEDTQYQLIQSAKLASIGRLVSDMAHEVNNPLMIISGRAQLSMVDAEEHGDKSAAENLRIISDQCSRARDIIKRLLLFSKPSKGEHKEADINETVDFVIALLEHQYSLNNITFVRQYDKLLPLVKIDEKQIHEVFMNIVRNSADAMHGGGTIIVTTKREGNNVRIDIQDTGEGIPEKNLVKIFDPFFTTKKTGTGLGLSVCYGIIKEAHGGDLRYASTVGKGTTASVILPLETKQA